MVNSRSSWGIVLHCQAGACRAILHATPSHSSPSQYTNTNTNTNTNSLLALLHYIHCLLCLHCFHCSHWLHCLNCLRCSTLLILLTLLSLITLNSLFSLLYNAHMYVHMAVLCYSQPSRCCADLIQSGADAREALKDH